MQESTFKKDWIHSSTGNTVRVVMSENILSTPGSNKCRLTGSVSVTAVLIQHTATRYRRAYIVFVGRRSRGSITVALRASAWSPRPSLAISQQHHSRYAPNWALMQNTAQIDILKKVTRQTIKYFIDPYAIRSAYKEIYRYVIPVSWTGSKQYRSLFWSPTVSHGKVGVGERQVILMELATCLDNCRSFSSQNILSNSMPKFDSLVFQALNLTWCSLPIQKQREGRRYLTGLTYLSLT